MCRIKLHICPYPDHDPVSSLIFNPKNAHRWELCDNPRPWGRLSCGRLEVEHPKHLTRARTPLSSKTAPTTGSHHPKQHEMHKQDISTAGNEPLLNDTVAPAAADEVLQGEPCKWCTAVLRLVATKSKEMQKLAREEIAEVERKIGDDAELKKMHEEIADREQELNGMRHDAWRKATVLMGGLADKTNRDETQG
ncbi:uncharacterized protein Z520_01177 [Fonsecaea multimorphosa CBS 102226]|uniref:Uncharacterized protein n=1 Tax=Fonsecaea multimorphosa CBS 102226 TaxID=1442371 RepID=A0A0D2J017_9EURO|nr:uncharacterized protein Z520_01177 [Fonsecaea multimorphosa CBS 102226]KIY02712.1 hypothetical protein Z520_01177 [Fonsecaea multimorphosa CBS 102226]OAL31573.1 hypothetical protein AYO22_01165 [Fonsecaea multimorphosa]